MGNAENSQAKEIQMCETPLLGVAFNSPALVTGLREQFGRWLVPPHRLQAVLAGISLL